MSYRYSVTYQCRGGFHASVRVHDHTISYDVYDPNFHMFHPHCKKDAGIVNIRSQPDGFVKAAKCVLKYLDDDWGRQYRISELK